MAQSYDNLGGSGNRRGGALLCWTEGAMVPVNPSIGLLADSGGGFWVPGSDATPFNIVFDFQLPRVVDEITIVFSINGYELGTWQVDGSNDRVSWVTLAAPSPWVSASALVRSLPGNTTPYRFYRFRRVEGTSSQTPNWSSARFRIDDQSPTNGWFSPYSTGARGALISVSGTAWSSVGGNYVVTNANAFATTPSYFTNGSGGTVILTFDTPQKLTGLRWVWQYAVEQGEWVVEGSENGSAWSLVSGPFLFSVQQRYPESNLNPYLETLFENEVAYGYYRLRQTGGSRSNGPYSFGLGLNIDGASAPALDIFPITGSLILTGSVPEIIADLSVNPLSAALVITGDTPTVHTETIIAPPAGSLTLTGQTPIVSVGVYVAPLAASLVITGQEPSVYTQSGTVASQVAMLSLSEVVPNAVASQIAALALAQPPAPPMRASQVAAMALAEVVPDVCASQAAILVLGYSSKCVTQNCQIWTITRRDGKVYRYTSLDRNLTYGGHVYKACGSMDPSASQNGATLGEVGSQSLTGLITDDGITEAELFGGLFDDAFVTTYLIDWSAPTIPPRRLASGWVGRVSQGPAFHTMEVLSVGARLEQTALVQVVSPSCRWQFGDSRCGVNVEAMKLPATIRRVINRGDLVLNIATPPDDGRIWASGRIRFLDGPCAGMVCEYKGVDFATGQIVLWSPAGLLPSAGNAVEVLPGCDLTRGGGCKAYNNRINFGGFADVPGADAILETPDAKI